MVLQPKIKLDAVHYAKINVPIRKIFDIVKTLLLYRSCFNTLYYSHQSVMVSF